MRVVVVTLSGKPTKAEELLSEHFPGAEIVNLPRADIDAGSAFERRSKLRKMGPDVFAIMTESLEWQFGQDALMLFGALAGARRSVIVDSHGRIRSAGRAEILLFYPARIARCHLRGRAALRNARVAIGNLEREVAEKGPGKKRSSSGNAGTNVAYLRATPAAGTQPGGATSHINGVVNGLLDLGAKITFISNDELAGLDTGRVEFKKFPPDPDLMPRAAFDVHNGMIFTSAAAGSVLEDEFDFIYQRYCRFSWAGVEASFKADVPLFLEYNGSEVWIGKNWDRTEQLDLLERCERLDLDAATRIFVISDVERRNLLDLGIAGEKIIVNPNGVDTDLFCPGVGGDSEREKLGIPSNKVIVGFVGTFGPWHGVLALADAISTIPKDAAIHFLLVGDGSLKGEFEKRLSDNKDLDRVTFAGVVPHERVPVMLDACDILVSPHVPLADGSEFFGSPTKLFEYMAMGKGIVASRLGQIGEVLSDEDTALLVEPGNVQQLCDGIIKLAADEELRIRLGTNARRSALKDHTWRRNAERVLDEFRSL